MAGHKVFSLVLWKKAVEILSKRPRATAEELADRLQCTDKVAENIKTDYRKIFKKKKNGRAKN